MNNYQNKTNIYYVYKHIDPDTKELLYIGQGSKGRAWVYAQGELREKSHDTYLMYLTLKGYTPDSWVEIVKTQLTREESCELETLLIWESEIYPKFNSKRDHCCILSQEDLKTINTYRTNGVSYFDIGKYMNCSTMTIYRAVNGKTKNYA